MTDGSTANSLSRGSDSDSTLQSRGPHMSGRTAAKCDPTLLMHAELGRSCCWQLDRRTLSEPEYNRAVD